MGVHGYLCAYYGTFWWLFYNNARDCCIWSVWAIRGISRCWIYAWTILYSLYSWTPYSRSVSDFSWYLPYCRKQNVLLFRKPEIWLFKVSITNMPHIFLGTKLFCFSRKKASYWFRISWILTKFQLIRTTFIFRCVTNRDVLLLTTIRYFYFLFILCKGLQDIF